MDVQALGPQSLSLPAVQRTREIAAPTEKAAPAARAPVFDEFVPEDPAAKRSAGIYRIVHGEDGTPKVRFDSPEDKAETTTCNTDDVDRELEKLRERRDSLTQQLQRAAGPEEAEKLDRKLRQVEQELSQKDNDTYRRQHAKFS